MGRNTNDRRQKASSWGRQHHRPVHGRAGRPGRHRPGRPRGRHGGDGGDRHSRVADGIDRHQTERGRHRRRHLRRGHRQVSRPERGRIPAAGAGCGDQSRIRRGRARIAQGPGAQPDPDPGQRPRRGHRRLVHLRPAGGHPKLQLPGAAVRHRQPASGVQEPHGGPGGRRHRRRGQRDHPQAAGPGPVPGRPVRRGGLHRPVGLGRSADFRRGELEEPVRDLRCPGRRRVPATRNPPRRHRGSGLRPGPGPDRSGPPGAHPDRLAPVPTGPRAHRRQHRAAVPPQRTGRDQHQRVVDALQRRQRQRQLPGLAGTVGPGRRHDHADRRSGHRRHHRRRHDLQHRGRRRLRSGLRHHRARCLRRVPLHRRRRGLAAQRPAHAACQGGLHRCRGRHGRPAVRGVPGHQRLLVRPARGAGGVLRHRRSDQPRRPDLRVRRQQPDHQRRRRGVRLSGRRARDRRRPPAVDQGRRQIHRPRPRYRLPGDHLRRLLPAVPRHRLRRRGVHAGVVRDRPGAVRLRPEHRRPRLADQLLPARRRHDHRPDQRVRRRVRPCPAVLGNLLGG